MKPTFSIILPVFNELSQIQAALGCLQPWRDRCQLLLVDGGSEDGGTNAIDPLVDYLLHSPPGRARQMNLGAAQATGDILLFLHIDTRLPEQAFTQIEQAIAAGYVWGRFDVCFDSTLSVFKVIAFMMNRRSCLTGIATGDQAIFITRTAFDAVNGYPEIALMEDIAISKRLKKLGRPACLTGKVQTSARRWLQNGILKTILFMWWLRLRYFFGADPAILAAGYYRKK